MGKSNVLSNVALSFSVDVSCGNYRPLSLGILLCNPKTASVV
jgi:hypothetical protein